MWPALKDEHKCKYLSYDSKLQSNTAIFCTVTPSQKHRLNIIIGDSTDDGIL